MRIIAGSLKSRRIEAPDGLETRPMLDRQRQALFDVLQGSFPCDGVLDVFAGSGALGFEALSRGAARATFVEAAAKARRVILANAERLGVRDRVFVLGADALAASWTDLGHEVDVAFFDPPFPLLERRPEAVVAVIARVAAEARCGPDAVFVLRVPRRAGLPPLPAALAGAGERVYGESRIFLLRPAAPGVAEPDAPGG